MMLMLYRIKLDCRGGLVSVLKASQSMIIMTGKLQERFVMKRHTRLLLKYSLSCCWKLKPGVMHHIEYGNQLTEMLRHYLTCCQHTGGSDLANAYEYRISEYEIHI